MDIEDIVKDALKGFDVEVLYTDYPEYKCKCSRERVESALVSLGAEELSSMANDLPVSEVKCHFCNTAYKFTSEEILKIIKKLQKNT